MCCGLSGERFARLSAANRALRSVRSGDQLDPTWCVMKSSSRVGQQADDRHLGEQAGKRKQRQHTQRRAVTDKKRCWLCREACVMYREGAGQSSIRTGATAGRIAASIVHSRGSAATERAMPKRASRIQNRISLKGRGGASRRCARWDRWQDESRRRRARAVQAYPSG